VYDVVRCVDNAALLNAFAVQANTRKAGAVKGSTESEDEGDGVTTPLKICLDINTLPAFFNQHQEVRCEL
jgi:hypothetical protein